MNREEIQKLLGGYATGTLTAEEQQILFEAALSDQELFDQLAREQALRDLLRDPAAKAQVLTAIEERSTPWYRRFAWWQPVGLAAAAALVLVVVTARKPHQLATVAQMDAVPARPGVDLDRREAAKAPLVTPSPAPERPANTRREAPRGAAKDVAKQVEPAPAGASLTPTAPVAPPPAAAPEPVTVLRDDKASNAPPTPKPVDEVQVQKEKRSLSLANGFRAGSGNIPLALIGGVQPGARALFYGNAAPAAAQAQTGGQQSQQAPSQQAPSPQQQGGVAGNVLYRQMMAKSAGSPANPAMRYRLLRKDAGGSLGAVAEKDVRTGDSIQLELMPNTDGLLTVTKDGRPIFTQPVVAMATYTIPVPAEDGAVEVVLARNGITVVSAASLPAGPSTQETAADGTFVAGQVSAQTLRFAIPIKVQ